MLLELQYYLLTFPVAMLPSVTTQLAKFAASFNALRILWFSAHLSKAYFTKRTFTGRAAWLALQAECPDLRRTYAILTQVIRPSKKLTNIKNVKRYLDVATIASDGLLVVKRNEPLVPTRKCIIVPRQVLDGLLSALHVHLMISNPSSHQLKMVNPLCPQYGQSRWSRHY